MGERFAIVKGGGYLTTKRELKVHLGKRYSYYQVEYRRGSFMVDHSDFQSSLVDWRLSLQKCWFLHKK